MSSNHERIVSRYCRISSEGRGPLVIRLDLKCGCRVVFGDKNIIQVLAISDNNTAHKPICSSLGA